MTVLPKDEDVAQQLVRISRVSLLVMRHPVNFIDLYFAERSSFDLEDLLEELWLRVQEVVVVRTP